MKIYVLQSNAFGENAIELYTSIEALINDPDNDVHISRKTLYNYINENKQKQLETIERYKNQEADISDLPSNGFPVMFEGNIISLKTPKGNKDIERLNQI